MEVWKQLPRVLDWKVGAFQSFKVQCIFTVLIESNVRQLGLIDEIIFFPLFSSRFYWSRPLAVLCQYDK